MKKTSSPLKKNLQEKVTDLLNAFVKSMTTVDTKKIKKSIRQASKIVAKSVAKSLIENTTKSPIKKPSARKKRTSLKPTKMIIAKPTTQNLASRLKNKQTNSQIKKSPAKKTVPQKSPKKTVAKPSAQNLSTLLKNKQAKLLKDNSAIPAPKKTSETTNQPKETGKSLEVVKKI